MQNVFLNLFFIIFLLFSYLFLIVLDKLQFNVVRVGAGQKYDAHSPIVDVMLDNIVKQKMNNLNEDNVSYLVTNKV